MGLRHYLVRHAEFGGATSATHQIVFRGVSKQAFQPVARVPQVLKHLLGSAAPGRFPSIDAPVDLVGSVPRAPIMVDGLLRQEGLLDVFHQGRLVACSSVFSATKWVMRSLSPYELLRAFDFPITLDTRLLSRCQMGQQLPFQMEESLSPLVVVSIIGSLWGNNGGLRWLRRILHERMHHRYYWVVKI